MIATFTVTMHLKSNPSKFEIKRYAKIAINRWGGGYEIDDLLFPTQIEKVIIGPIKKCAEKEIG